VPARSQALSNKLAGESSPPRSVPLAIMTSDDTHARTVALLAAHGDFGMAAGQITLLKQEKVAALVDNAAHMALEAGGGGLVLETKPHGHGDVHTLLASSGLAARWAADGRRFVVFFQDTNALAFTVTQAALGVSLREGFEVNSIAVPRKAKDAVGGIARLVRADGSGSMTVNVEYNQLEPLLRANGCPEGDVNGPDGYSPFPGNINQLIFALPPYAAVLARTGGLVPEFVNPKYADAAKTTFKKPTRLECMMQDHPKVLAPGARVGFTQFPDWTYSPVKNSVDEGRAKIAQGAPGRTAAEGELEYYGAGARQLAAIGAPAPPPATLRVFGAALPAPALVVFAPSFAPSFRAMRERFARPADVRVTARSVLVLAGDIAVDALDVDGTLVIRAAPGARVHVKRARAHNAGWALRPLTDEEAAAAPDHVRIRGFTLEKSADRTLTFDAPGDYVVDDE
jgi:UDP-sugar pyrophosphorylase